MDILFYGPDATMIGIIPALLSMGWTALAVSVVGRFAWRFVTSRTTHWWVSPLWGIAMATVQYLRGNHPVAAGILGIEFGLALLLVILLENRYLPSNPNPIAK
ncbi:MAG: hypothetical protein RLZZ324_1162 [Candidatus Parcubacteria bacterium]|jgi:predicted alpha/beta hydrolase